MFEPSTEYDFRLSSEQISELFKDEEKDEDDNIDIDALLKHLSNDYDKEDRINTNGVYLYSNLGAVINKLIELSYFDIDIKEIPLRIDDIEKTYYKVNISAAPDKKLSQREIDILVRSLDEWKMPSAFSNSPEDK